MSFVIFKVQGDALVVVVSRVGADDVRVQLHLAVRLRHLERLVVAFRHHQEFYGGTVIVQFLCIEREEEVGVNKSSQR